MHEFTTPMMKQYMQIRQKYKDCLLFYRMGDFYELFMDDAHVGARVLNITLTSRPRGKDGRIPMAGVPFHAVDAYLAKLVKAGYKVAICEQISEPSKKGIIEREVIRIVTPGTVLDEKALEKKENNYIISIMLHEKTVGLALADISTAQFYVTQFTGGNLDQCITDEIAKFHPTECVLTQSMYNKASLLNILTKYAGLNVSCYFEGEGVAQKSRKYLQDHFKLQTLASFGLDDYDVATQAAAVLLAYLKDTQKNHIEHITKIQPLETDRYLQLDRSTIVNLELFSTLREHEKKGSLIDVLDETTTAMGGRMLRDWIRKPLYDTDKIENRQMAIEYVISHPSLQTVLHGLLEEVIDVERLTSRLAVGIGNPRDVSNLMRSLQAILKIKKELSTHNTSLFKTAQKMISPEIQDIIEAISRTIVDEPPIDVREGGIIQKGINTELDALRDTVHGSHEWIANMEQAERKRTGISSLKVKFNKVFGFYIEVSNANLSLVPKDYFRKQTLVNGERFMTPELKHHEEIILTAEEKINEMEYRLFVKLLEYILQRISLIQTSANAIAALDCILSLAIVAQNNNYCKPTLLDTGEIQITQGRHPVVEQLLDHGTFVANDVQVNTTDQELLIITGPNMAGKSVFIRQIALISLMTQIGSFVPAKEARMSLVDRIFVRSGASDIITSGLSTFMVEMVETALILNQATKNSLIIMDEIGRGTSTYDGISIAWAVAWYIVTAIQAKTLFATHYHELETRDQTHVPELHERPDITQHIVCKELDAADIHQMTPLEALNFLARLKNTLKLSSHTEEGSYKVD